MSAVRKLTDAQIRIVRDAMAQRQGLQQAIDAFHHVGAGPHPIALQSL